MGHDHRVPIASVTFRTIPSRDGRWRVVSLEETRGGRRVKVESFDKDGRLTAGTLLLHPDDLPAFATAMVEAAAAIGVEMPAHPTTRTSP